MKKINFKNSIMYTLNQKSGFTLIETLVALSIFVVSVLLMVSVSARGIVDTRNATNKATATFLADEGVELMRNIRDSYSLGGGGNSTLPSTWQTFYNDVLGECGGNDGCKVGPRFDLTNLKTTTNVYICNNLCEKLVRTSYGYYGYDESGANFTETNFRRIINVESISADILKVTSRVEWSNGTNTSSVEVEGFLYNWYE